MPERLSRWITDMYARGSLEHPDRGTVLDNAGGPPAAGRGTLPRGSWFHESLDTLILGTLSTSLGVVLIVVPLLRTLGSGVRIDLPLTTYLALVPIGTSIGIIGIVRARMMNRFTSPLSTLGALLCFAPASPQLLGSLGIYLLILSPFAIAFYGPTMVENLARRLFSKTGSNDDPSGACEEDRAD